MTRARDLQPPKAGVKVRPPDRVVLHPDDVTIVKDDHGRIIGYVLSPTLSEQIRNGTST